jgi:hypothetical protein
LSDETQVATKSRTGEVAITSAGIRIRNLDDLRLFAKYVQESGLAPKSDKKEMTGQEIMIATEMGLEVGLPPMQALQSIAVINGRPAIWGDAAKALVEASGLCEEFHECVTGEGEEMEASCEVLRVGREAPVTQTFSYREAKQAGLFRNEVWAKYTRRMLQMRARSWAIRDAFPDVLKGLAVAEEVRDVTDVTPTHAESVEASETDLGAWTKNENAKEAEAAPMPPSEDEQPADFEARKAEAEKILDESAAKVKAEREQSVEALEGDEDGRP